MIPIWEREEWPNYWRVVVQGEYFSTLILDELEKLYEAVVESTDEH